MSGLWLPQELGVAWNGTSTPARDTMVRGEAVHNLRSGLLVREGRELNLLDAHTDRMEFRYLALSEEQNWLSMRDRR